MAKVTIRTKQRAWKKTQRLLESLTAEDLRQAANEERKYHKISNPAVLELLKLLGQVRGTTSGSDEKKSYMLTELKSSFIYFGCPVIYLTLNPGDRHSPLALLYAGVKINVKNFIPEEYSFTDRVQKLLGNPLAVVEYFHNMVKAIIEGVFKEGMFGELVHHYGTIEYQGRFTPHMHMAVLSPILIQRLTDFSYGSRERHHQQKCERRRNSTWIFGDGCWNSLDKLHLKLFRLLPHHLFWKSLKRVLECFNLCLIQIIHILTIR